MQYMIMFREALETFALRNDPAKAEGYWGAWMAYVGALHQAGVVVSGAGLAPPDAASVVRVRDGGRRVEDGPYADSKQQLGGFFVIEVPNLNVALEWAARSPAAVDGSVEVRPTLPPPPQQAAG